jgi:hypothetical protein
VGFKGLFGEGGRGYEVGSEDNKQDKVGGKVDGAGSEIIWFQILHDITDYDVCKIMEILKMNHQMIFSHILMVSRRNRELNKEFKKKMKK